MHIYTYYICIYVWYIYICMIRMLIVTAITDSSYIVSYLATYVGIMATINY